MQRQKQTIANRVISVVLVLLMVANLVAIASYVSYASNEGNVDTYTIKVVSGGEVVKDAAVNYTICVDGEEKESGSVTTGTDGCAAISGMADYETGIQNGTVTISYQVSKDGFESSEQTDIAVTDVNGSIEVSLSAIPVSLEEKTVEVTATGNGTVKLNGQEKETITVEQGTEISLLITPKDKVSDQGTNKTYIKLLKINGEEQEVEKYESYRKDNFKVDDDTAIEVKFATEFTITGNVPENGTITLGSQELTRESNSVTADEGTTVNLKVEPEECYQIKSVKIDGKTVVVPDTTGFSENITVDHNIEVEVQFELLYFLTVKYKSGTITSTPKCVGGSVTVEEGPEIKIKAVPDTNYRVSKVLRNNESMLEDQTANGYKYEHTISNTGEDCTYQIWFALNQYEITAVREGNGTVSFDRDKDEQTKVVDHDTDVSVHIVPDENYRVKRIVITEKDKESVEVDPGSENYKADADGSSTYTLKNIKADYEIKVEFAEEEMASASLETYVSFGVKEGKLASKYLDKDGNYVYVYLKGSKVTIEPVSPSYDQVDIRYAGKDASEGYRKSETVNESREINMLKIRKSMGFDVLNALGDKKVRIIIGQDEPDITLTVPEPNEHDYYKEDIKIGVKVNAAHDENGLFSGISEIKYCVASGTEQKDIEGGFSEHLTTKGIDGTPGYVSLYNAEEDPAGIEAYDEEITIDAEKNNTDYVKLRVEATDWSGNTRVVDQIFKISTTAPMVQVEMADVSKAEAETGYYERRKATISVTERSSTFDGEAMLDKGGIWVKAKDSDGEPVGVIGVREMAGQSEWITVEGETPDEDVHTITLTFSQDANYEWGIAYKNQAGNQVSTAIISKGDTWKFTVDAHAPAGQYGTCSIKINDENSWREIMETLTFGLFKNKNVIAEVEAKDATSPIKDITYYKSNDYYGLSEEELENLYWENKFSSEQITVEADEVFVIYARISDRAGNVVYIGTNGIVVDLTRSVVEITTEKANDFGYYSDDVKVDISINDNDKDKGLGESQFSGIKKVDYKVVCEYDGGKREITQSGNLYTYDAASPEHTQFETGTVVLDKNTNLPESFSDSIIVDSAKNNSDNVYVQITVEDNAGNVMKPEESYKPDDKCQVKLRINSGKPTAKVTFTDEPNRADDGYGWFREERTAVIEITDRNTTFDSEAATEGIQITGTNYEGKKVELDAEAIDGWTSEGDKHTANVVFSNDARYEWSISYINKAGKGFVNEEVEYSGISPNQFTVDKTEPEGTVTVGQNTWEKILSTLTFGLYKNTVTHVSATASDETSPYTITYYKTSDPIAKGEKELDQLAFTEYSDFDVDSDEQFVVYLKITDYAGNYTYISSDGVIVDQAASRITLTPEEANENNAYNNDVNVGIKVEEAEPYAGIRSVEYWVEADGEETQRKTLYSFDYIRDTGMASNGGSLTVTDWSTGQEIKTEYEGQVPSQAQLCKEWNGNITVSAAANNSSNVVVHVRTEDNAGNADEKTVGLDIDVTRPEITVSYDNNSDNGGNGYFANNRTATIRIRERTDHFNAAKATDGIKITAKDAKGKTVDTGSIISEWKTSEGSKPDDALHVATIAYNRDANYTFEVSYTDEAGNVNQTVDTGDSAAPYTFTVDKAAPKGTITSETAEGRKDSWSSLVRKLSFGIWSRKKIDITAETSDDTSPVASVQYYKTSDPKEKTVSDLANVTWSEFDSLTVKANEQFTIYLKITDMAGNTAYISTDGMIVDDTDPRIEGIAPKISVSPEQPVNGFYNRNVKVAINVQEPTTGGTYSGIKTVSYRVLNRGKVSQEGVLYSFKKESPSRDEIQEKWSGSITVDSKKNNSNDVEIEIFAEDNSLNSVKEAKHIKIDITKPTIHVSYNNNRPDSEKYYKDDRTATITVSERNFDPKDIVVDIKNTDGTIPRLSGWKTVKGSGNLDDTKHIATLTYAADGDYTFDINYTDLAHNKCSGETYADGTANPTEFTIDKTVPVITVSYDNNDVANSEYFKKQRTATVTVAEHNFDVGRVQFTQSASLDGKSIHAPAPSWSSSGDTHTATIVYDSDGDYTFDVTMSDLAGNKNSGVNYASGEAAKKFTVDTKINKPVISGVENGKAYPGAVSLGIDLSDVNYDDYSVKLTRTRRDEKDVDVTDQFITGMTRKEQGVSGINNTFEMVQENDGIYTLTVRFHDRAGNKEKEVVTFTLNRFGSVYAYNDYLISLIGDGGAYVQAVDGDFEITEYNADRLVKGSLAIEITRDGKPVGEVDYEVSPEINDMVEVGESGWFQYRYTVRASNFKEDGVYKMTVSSEDATNNTSENTNYEDQGILFRVDATAPEINSVSGLEENVVNATGLDVEYTVFDTIGLSSVSVYVDEEEKENVKNFAGDANNYAGTFRLEENSSAQNVRIVVADLAGNVTDTDSDGFTSSYDFHKVVTVSTNFFVRWYANKVLFWGSIGGVLALICLSVLVIRKKVS